MIKLYRHKNDEEADEVQDRLEQLVLAYELELFEEGELNDFFIKDGDTKIKNGKPMEDWFRLLENELSVQRSISGDGCYVDPETGKIC